MSCLRRKNLLEETERPIEKRMTFLETYKCDRYNAYYESKISIINPFRSFPSLITMCMDPIISLEIALSFSFLCFSIFRIYRFDFEPIRLV